MVFPSTKFDEHRYRGYEDMGLLAVCMVFFAVADDVIKSPMTSLDVFCHGVPFHKV